MGSFDAARGLAETVLAAQLPDVWERAQRAAIAARGRGDDPGVDRDLLMTAAILHPIGASPVVRRTGDERADAARFLEIRGYAPDVVDLVAGRTTGPTADALRRAVATTIESEPDTGGDTGAPQKH